MWGEKCKFERTMNDLYRYCWNKGCIVNELVDRTSTNFLYMTRALLDAAIVWYEGVEEDKSDDIEQWHNLARATGESFAEIIKEATGFTP